MAFAARCRPAQCSLRVAALCLAAVVAACIADTPAGLDGSREPVVSLSKNSDDDVTVSSVEPSSAPQDTTIVITVKGSGFDRSAVVTFETDGQPAAGITTNSTRFRNPKTLEADITIAADADPIFYDAVVSLSNGKRGIGTMLFQVKVRGRETDDSRATFEVDEDEDPVTDFEPVLLSDGRGAYVHGDCGVQTRIWWEDSNASQSGDATIDMDNGYDQKTVCGDGVQAPRRMFVNVPAGETYSVWYTSVRQVMQLAVDEEGNERDPGTSGLRVMGFLTDGPKSCERIRMGIRAGEKPEEDEMILATYLGRLNGDGPRQWLAESRPPHTARCFEWRRGRYQETGEFPLPFRIIVTEVPTP